jgi:hypothetical protein
MDQPRTENTRDLLDRHERMLLAQRAALQTQMKEMQGQIAQLDIEIGYVRRAKGAIGPTDEERARWDAELKKAADEIKRRFDMYREIGDRLRTVPPAELKIKDLIARVFMDRFPDGATPAEIGEQIAASHRRTIDPGSIRPNLARLRVDGIIEQGVGTRWVRVPEAATAILHHYKGEGEDDGYFMVLATAFAWKEPE